MINYQLKDFNYHLPKNLIAQKPIRPRDHSRLLVLNKENGEIEHKHFYDLGDYLKAGDLLVLNNSKVFPARLIGKKKITGGKIEIFLHQEKKTLKYKANIWECLVKGKIKPGQQVNLSQGLVAEILSDNIDGVRRVKFNISGDLFWKIIYKVGLVPLPPYIKRGRRRVSDIDNYQTIFADERKLGSVAAPTAGLHFTKELIDQLKNKGVKITYLSLHVGLGTFTPVKTKYIKDHKMHSEFVMISKKTIKDIIRTKRNGGRVIAIGTTSARSLESLFIRGILNNNFNNISLDKAEKQYFWTDIFIHPGYKFKIVDALITNFHLPKSSLLMLVSALATKSNIDRAYKVAISLKYRFFSYGDAMFIY